MNCTGEGLLIHLHSFSDSKSVATLFHSTYGLVKGCLRVSSKSLIRVGAFYNFEKKSRLSEQLGFITLESAEDSPFICSHVKLSCMNAMRAMLYLFVAENEESSWLYDRVKYHWKAICTTGHLGHYALFEKDLLSHSGYHLDLSKCAVTNQTEDLYYISPKTGRAVIKSVGEPYANSLFLMPELLRSEDPSISGDLSQSFQILQYFLKKWLLEHHHKKLPIERNLAVKHILPQ
jgi:DNA repair protein RecO (recombination protein O)